MTAPGAGAVFGPHIRAFDVDGGAVTAKAGVSFYAYRTLKWGARVAAGDLDGDGRKEMITAPGPSPEFGSHVRGFRFDGVQTTPMGRVSFFAFPTIRDYGATVGASDIESDGDGGYGDGYDEIVAARGPNPYGYPEVSVFDIDSGSPAQKTKITPFATLYGVNVTGGDADYGDAGELVMAPGPDPAAAARVQVWEWDPGITDTVPLPGLHLIGPDDFVALGYPYGANIAVGRVQ